MGSAVVARAVAAIGLLLFSACVSGDLEPAPVSASAGCELIIDAVDELPDGYMDLAASAALPVPVAGMQTGRREDGYRFSKFGMAVAAGVRTSVTIDPAQGDAYLDYGRQSESVPPHRPRRVTFGACPSPGGAWVVYAGGVWTTQDGCIDFTVSSTEGTETATIGIRATC